MRYFFILLLILPFLSFAQKFEPIPEKSKPGYQFNLQKNFFPTETDYYKKVAELSDSLCYINSLLNNENNAMNEWISIIQQYSRVEATYRVIDLYLFLRFAINMNDEKADRESDSLRNMIRLTRTLIKQKIAAIKVKEADKITTVAPGLTYYIKTIRNEKLHILTPAEEKLIEPYRYTRSSGFYDDAFGKMKFEKLKTADGEIDVLRERSAWENDPDVNIQKSGSRMLFEGYAGQRDFLGYNYIQFIKGLNANAVSRNYEGLINEKLNSWMLPANSLQSFFDNIIKGAKENSEKDSTTKTTAPAPMRFTIQEATGKIEKALSVLGKDYKIEVANLLDPQQGRIDLFGDGNRIPIRGTASVYPVFPSIFYALNYEGYMIDLTLLAHEIGHAVQASLMYKNEVPMIYATGPAYFTESFGKFNELLLFDFLCTNEKDNIKRKVYANELKNKIDVLYGSTHEAYIEYSLVKGILYGNIKTPNDLDSFTVKAGAAIFPGLYKEQPEHKGLWMIMETNFREPLHNINDMIAAALAIKYYQLYKSDKVNFIARYLTLLKEGYHDSPPNLLKSFGIDIRDENFIKSVVEFVVQY
ncbi:MAG: hypothetical protein ABIP79_05820 [Chitinophagaceae bacterium]